MLKLTVNFKNRKVQPRPLATETPTGNLAGDKQEVTFVFSLPPSLNDQYVKFRKRGGAKGFALSEEAKAFEKNVKSVVGSQVYSLQGFPTGDREVLYELLIRLYFDKLENPGWFERFGRGPNSGERKAVSRYKKLDADNRIKFLQDRLCAAVGIPGDEQIFRVISEKHFSQSNPRSEAVLRVVDRKEFFRDEN